MSELTKDEALRLVRDNAWEEFGFGAHEIGPGITIEVAEP